MIFLWTIALASSSPLASSVYSLSLASSSLLASSLSSSSDRKLFFFFEPAANKQDTQKAFHLQRNTTKGGTKLNIFTLPSFLFLAFPAFFSCSSILLFPVFAFFLLFLVFSFVLCVHASPGSATGALLRALIQALFRLPR